MKNRTKIFIVGLSVGLVATFPLEGIGKNANVVQARYDGWASSNKISSSYYVSNSELKNYDIGRAINSLAGYVIGQLTPFGKVGGGISAIIGSFLRNGDLERSKVQAISQGKGLFIRLRYSYTKNSYGQLVPSSVEAYYSVM